MSKSSNTTGWDGIERRAPNSCRRKNPDRRSYQERRGDPRQGHRRKRSLISWLRSFTRSRLGVDRRKGAEQRIYDRRNNSPRSLLTRDELNDLLK